MMRFWITVLLLLTAMGVSGLSARRVPDVLAMPLESISTRISGWEKSGSQLLPAGTMKTLAPTSYLSRSYTKHGDELNLFVVFYAQQRAGETMHSPKACLPANGWEIWKHEPATMQLEDGAVTINKYFIQSAGRRMVVYYWYQSKRRIIANEYLGKILLMTDTLRDGHTAGGLVRIMVADKPGLAEEGLAFAAQVAPQIGRCFKE